MYLNIVQKEFWQNCHEKNITTLIQYLSDMRSETTDLIVVSDFLCSHKEKNYSGNYLDSPCWSSFLIQWERYFNHHSMVIPFDEKTFLFLHQGKRELFPYGTEIDHQETKILVVSDLEQLYSKRDGIPSRIVLLLARSQYFKSVDVERCKKISSFSREHNCLIVFINALGVVDNKVYDGNSMIFKSSGEHSLSLPQFKSSHYRVNVREMVSHVVDRIPMVEQTYNALVMGVRHFFESYGFRKAIIGFSGGIDSAVTAALAVAALGADNVYGVALPSQFSSQHSVDDAESLAKNLCCPFDIIPIRDGYEAIYKLLEPYFAQTKFNIAEENIQARLRGLLLMALSNKFGYILLNTSNKSESCVGYGTLYGDLCGSLAVLADVYKTEVYELASFINRNREIIPMNTIIKPPSAELRPDQKDSDSLPDYEILDAILEQMIEEERCVADISENFDPQTVNRVVNLFYRSAFKRKQTAPAIQVSKRPLLSC